jgi:hypothetical protein
LCRIANKSSADVHGWTGELLRAACSNAVVFNAVRTIVCDIVNDSSDLNAQSRTRLLASELVAITKKTDMTKKRPICMPSVFIKLAERVVVNMLTKADLDDIFPTMQYGINVAGGCEQALHILQRLIEVGRSKAHAGEGEYIVVNVDLKNAFNATLRHNIATALHSRDSTSCVWNIFNFMYGTPSLLLMYDDDRLGAVLLSLLGARQGGTLSSLLFATALQDVLKLIEDQCPEVELACIHDDINMFGRTVEVMHAFDKLLVELRKRNLVVQQAKSNVLHCTDVASEELRAMCAERQLPEPAHHMITLGKCVSFDGSKVKEHLAGSVKDAEWLMKAIQHKCITVPNQLKLLRACGLSKLNYMARVTPPEVADEAMRRFDDAVLSTASSMFQLSYDELQRNDGSTVRQMRLPMRSGGLGLRPYHGYVNAASFFASQGASARRLQRVTEKYTGSSSIETTTTQQLAACHQLLTEAGASSELKDKRDQSIFPAAGDATAILDFYSKISVTSLQKSLTAVFDKRSYKALTTSLAASKADLARLKAVATPGARTMLVAPTSCSKLTLTNFEFIVMIRLMLGVTPVGQLHMPTSCACKQLVDGEAVKVDHLFTCAKANRLGFKASHNMVRDVLADRCREVGYVVDPEHRFAEFDLQPDLVVSDFSARQFLVEVSIVMPSAASYNGPASRDALAAAQQREANKRRKYQVLAQTLGSELCPFVVERFGGLAKSAEEFLNQLEVQPRRAAAPLPDGFTAHQYLRTSIAKAIHVGNAELVRLALMESRAYKLQRALFVDAFN